MVDQHFNKVAALQYTARNFSKNGANVGSLCRSPENVRIYWKNSLERLLNLSSRCQYASDAKALGYIYR